MQHGKFFILVQYLKRKSYKTSSTTARSTQTTSTLTNSNTIISKTQSCKNRAKPQNRSDIEK